MTPTDDTTSVRSLKDEGTRPGSRERFAAYDTRLARFVGGVHDTEAAAKAAAKDAGVDRPKIRRV